MWSFLCSWFGYCIHENVILKSYKGPLRYSQDHTPTIHVINVAGKHGELRRKNIVRTTGSYPYEFVAAHVPTIPIQQNKKCINEGVLTQGNMALVRSHSSLYERLLKSEEPWMLIAEDDIELVSNFKIQIAAVTKKLPKHFDVIKLEYCNKEPIVSRVAAIYERQGGPCTALYIVSREGAQLLLDINPPSMPCLNADGILDPFNHPAVYSGHRLIRIFHTVPPLGWQNKEKRIRNSGGQHASSCF